MPRRNLYQAALASDPDGVRAAAREANAKWRAAHPGYNAEAARKWRAAHPELAREQTRRQMAKRRAAVREGEEIDRMLVFERDGGICGMCHRPVDAGAFEVDHTVPLSAGGQHVYANVRPVHPLCNRTGRPRL